MSFLKILMLVAFGCLSISAFGEDCVPEATQQLSELMNKVTKASIKVDTYQKKFKTESNEKSDLIVFCLSNEARAEFGRVYTEAAPAVNNLEAFEVRQTGDCKASAQNARLNLENNVRKIMSRFDRCKQGL